MFEHGENTAIGALRICAQAAQIPSTERDIRSLQWPQVDSDWVFVRRVAVRDSAQGLPSRLAGEVRQQIREAAWPDSPGAGTAGAIRFRSKADMLAWLSGDLADAAPRWYWQRWQPLFQRPPAAAITELWSEGVSYLPAIIARLQALGKLGPVWRQLDEPAAQRLLAAIEWFSGYRLTELAPSAAQPLPTGDRIFDGLQSWRPLLAGEGADAARVRLAAVIHLWRERPQFLATERAPAVLRQLSLFLAGADGHPIDHLATSGATVPGPAEANSGIALASPRGSAGEVSGDDKFTRAESAEAVPVCAESSTAARRVAAGRDQPRPLPEAPREQPAIDGANSNMESDAHQEISVADSSFHTGYGGVFYLLNVLSRQELADCLAPCRDVPIWQQVTRIALAFGLHPEDELAFLLAELCHAEGPRLEDLPPLPGEPVLLDAILELYDARLRDAWLRQGARVDYTDSHLDIFFDAPPTDIDIRLWGLDLDPGWLPSAGRVIHFHYPAYETAGCIDGD